MNDKPISNGNTSTDDKGTFWTAEEKAEMLQNRQAREALKTFTDAIIVIRQHCMTLNEWTYGDKNAWGKPNKKAGEKGSMYHLDASKFCDLANKCLPKGVPYKFVPRGSKNEVITMEHIDGKTPLVPNQVYN
jgi:hypothetical protein